MKAAVRARPCSSWPRPAGREPRRKDAVRPDPLGRVRRCWRAALSEACRPDAEAALQRAASDAKGDRGGRAAAARGREGARPEGGRGAAARRRSSSRRSGRGCGSKTDLVKSITPQRMVLVRPERVDEQEGRDADRRRLPRCGAQPGAHVRRARLDGAAAAVGGVGHGASFEPSRCADEAPGLALAIGAVLAGADQGRGPPRPRAGAGAGPPRGGRRAGSVGDGDRPACGRCCASSRSATRGASASSSGSPG